MRKVEDGLRLSALKYCQLASRPDTTIRHRRVFVPPSPPVHYAWVLSPAFDGLQAFFMFDAGRVEWVEVDDDDGELEALFS